jgi:hypothetical protein
MKYKTRQELSDARHHLLSSLLWSIGIYIVKNKESSAFGEGSLVRETAFPPNVESTNVLTLIHFPGHGISTSYLDTIGSNLKLKGHIKMTHQENAQDLIEEFRALTCSENRTIDALERIAEIRENAIKESNFELLEELISVEYLSVQGADDTENLHEEFKRLTCSEDYTIEALERMAEIRESAIKESNFEFLEELIAIEYSIARKARPKRKNNFDEIRSYRYKSLLGRYSKTQFGMSVLPVVEEFEREQPKEREYVVPQEINSMNLSRWLSSISSSDEEMKHIYSQIRYYLDIYDVRKSDLIDVLNEACILSQKSLARGKVIKDMYVWLTHVSISIVRKISKREKQNHSRLDTWSSYAADIRAINLAQERESSYSLEKRSQRIRTDRKPTYSLSSQRSDADVEIRLQMLNMLQKHCDRSIDIEIGSGFSLDIGAGMKDFVLGEYIIRCETIKKTAKIKFKYAIKAFYTGALIAFIGLFVIQKGEVKLGSILSATAITAAFICGRVAQKAHRQIREIDFNSYSIQSRRAF